jgi:small-conductance mechanosensitive channel
MINESARFSLIVTIILMVVIDWFLSWKISHTLKEWGLNTKEGDLNSKLMFGYIMVTLIFMFSIIAIIIHSLVTGKFINITIIYLVLVLFIGYLASLIFLSKFKGTTTDVADTRKE